MKQFTTHLAGLIAVLSGALALSAPAPAAAEPLLLLDGGDTAVVLLDMGSRTKTGDLRTASIYRGAIAQGGRPRTITGEKRAFDCPGRRQRLVATLTRTAAGATVETPVEGDWQAAAWKSSLDYAMVAVCLGIYDRERISTKSDVPSILMSLEQVWEPGHYQPTPAERAAAQPKPKKRSLLRPF